MLSHFFVSRSSLPKIEDITVSGSNAAYSYTDSSDLDLHILIDMNQLPDDEVYRELFDAKKKLYNDEHQITVRGIPVELYVQDANQKHVSLGEAGFTGEIMGDRVIMAVDKLFDTWTPREKYELINCNEVKEDTIKHELLY